MDEVDDFLAHYGVKGMKWGERKTATSARMQTYKKIGTEVGFGAIGPAILLAGLGPPVSIAIGMSVTVLRQPAVKKAIAETSKVQAQFLKEVGQTKMSAVRAARSEKEKLKSRTKKVAAEAAQPEHLMMLT